MPHEPKLTAYVLQLKPKTDQIENSNRNLFKNKINEAESDDLEDSYIFTEIFRLLVNNLDTNEMYIDSQSKKCMTAYQHNIESENIDPNLFVHSENFIIEGKIEGGAYGKKRNKTETSNRSNKSEVSENDAITDDFYFLLYSPLNSNKSILLIQSYSDDSIDSVVKKFFTSFFSYPLLFSKATSNKFVPRRIINDFRNGATISSFTYTTHIPSTTLLGSTVRMNNESFKITFKIEPIEENISYDEFGLTVRTMDTVNISNIPLRDFNNRRGNLADSSTGKTTPFELNSSFDIKPLIILSKYITIEHNESDFERIRDFCLDILEEMKQEIYPRNAVRER